MHLPSWTNNKFIGAKTTLRTPAETPSPSPAHFADVGGPVFHRMTRMPSLKLRVGLTHKILAIGATGILGLFLIAGIYLIGNSTQQRFREEATEARALHGLMSNLLTTMLQSRRAEKDFLLRSDESYAKHHGELATAINGNLESLQKQARAAGLSDLEQKAGVIRAGFETYTKSFNGMVAARTRLGLDENAGLEGALRNSVHGIENTLNQFDDPRLANVMLMMRRHEKDFMLRREAKYGDDMKKRATEFTSELAGAPIPAATKEDITKKLTAYQRDFVAWMAGANDLASAQKATSAAYATIEPVIEGVQQTIDQVRAKAEAAEQATNAETQLRMKIAILAILAGVAALALMIGRAVSKPLTAMTRAMRELAASRFDVTVPGLGRADEIGEMGEAVEVFRKNGIEVERMRAERAEQDARATAERTRMMRELADQFQSAVGEIINSVSSASTELEAAASTLTQTAETTQERSSSVAAASEQASANVNSVASATEELGSSVNEISRQVQESSRIASEAVKQAERTNQRINELSKAAGRIGDVVKLITAVAEQTNLLALNATIEAARAGEAGKGFAVVAQEVKALAAQTAKATDEIGTQITGMQGATTESVGAIQEIGSTIARISEIASTIAAAVEEQGAATQEIARNVQQAAQGTKQVAGDISEVNRGASETGSASAQVLSSAQSLSSESNHLKVEVEKFLTTVRAA
jgi:methyl-accepting chemotaxis protein